LSVIANVDERSGEKDTPKRCPQKFAGCLAAGGVHYLHSEKITRYFMSSQNLDVILKRFESPDETRQLVKGKFEIVHLGGMTIGRATYEPGWRWSEHVGKALGATHCQVEHVGMVLSGVATAAFDDGRVIEMHPGELFYIPPIPHDSWVVGNETYVSLHFLGADHYAK
jgi:quercetin dioxygenase-like cupin family protein